MVLNVVEDREREIERERANNSGLYRSVYGECIWRKRTLGVALTQLVVAYN